MNKNMFVTAKQAEYLRWLGFKEKVVGRYYASNNYVGDTRTGIGPDNWNAYKGLISAPTLDEAIDWLRRKFNVHIYTAIEPFVDPTNKEAPVLYRYTVKYCSRRDGWNGRIYIGQTRLAKNVYSLKRQAITLAIRWLNKRNKEKKTLSK